MISPEEAGRLKDQLLAVLAEDAHNTERLLSRLDTLSRERGIEAHAALLLILTHLAFPEAEAKRHWEAILVHRNEMSTRVGRDVGLRVAVLDYFMNVNRRLVNPALIDLEMFEAGARSRPSDPLTGLATDRAFRAAVQNELRRSRRYGQKAALALFDLDGFAETMERVGGLVAERFLRETAMLLHNKVRDIDLAARPGADELALLLPETDRNGALLVAERFRREVEVHFSRRETSGQPTTLTVSGGVACYPEDARTSETLLERAAQALYRAKAAGKNTIHVFHPERRRFLRFDLEPGRFEVEVLAPVEATVGRIRNLSRNGIVFGSPEVLGVGEEIEIRVTEASGDASPRPLKVSGRVVRIEELPPPASDEAGGAAEGDAEGDRFEIGVAFDPDSPGGEQDLFEFLERARSGPTRGFS